MESYTSDTSSVIERGSSIDSSLRVSSSIYDDPLLDEIVKKGDSGLVEEALDIDFNDLDIHEEIGSGSFGQVLKASYFGTEVAVKKLFNVDDKMMQKYIQRELATLKNIRHPNVVQFMGLSKNESGIFIVTEFVPGGDLTSILGNGDLKISWKILVKIAIETAQAMAYIHAKGVVHRDLKCSNLLIDENWKVKVCDFGMARQQVKDPKALRSLGWSMTICGTDEYMAPEVLLGDDYNEKADVFSFGICLSEMILRRIPTQRGLARRYAFDENLFRSLCPPSCPSSLAQLVIICCQTEPSRRPTFAALLRLLQPMAATTPSTLVPFTPHKPKTPTAEQLASVLDDVDLDSRWDSSRPSTSRRATEIGTQRLQEATDPQRRNTVETFSVSVKQRGTVGRRSEAVEMSTPLHEAVGHGDLKEVDQWMAEEPLWIVQRDSLGETPLFAAVRYSHVELVKRILSVESGASTANVPNAEGSYPIHIACKNSNVKVVQLLLDANAKLKIQDSSKRYPLHIACELGNYELVDLILSRGPRIILETNEQGETPLLLCCRLGHHPLVQLLLSKGANVQITDSRGRTPLWYIAQKPNLSLAEALAKAGANIDNVAEDGTTPLYHSMKANNLELSIFLVKQGASLTRFHKHSLGSTPEFRQQLLAAQESLSP